MVELRKIFLLCYSGAQSLCNLYRIETPIHALPIIPLWSDATLLGSLLLSLPIQVSWVFAGKEDQGIVRETSDVRGVDRQGQQRPRKVELCDR
jgi:hypothetical protein